MTEISKKSISVSKMQPSTSFDWAMQTWTAVPKNTPIGQDARSGKYPETRVSVKKIKNTDPRLKKHDDWIGAHVDNDVYWPQEPHTVEFENILLFVLPAEKELLPAVFVRIGKEGKEDSRDKISRFLSSWSWADNKGIRILHLTGGSKPFRAQDRRMNTTTHFFDFENLPENLSSQAALALAFYREGLSLKHTAYGFLSFYKVINAIFKGKNAQKNWIRDNIKNLTDEQSVSRLAELDADSKGQSVQDYIWSSCRNAVAHSHPDGEVINPDSPQDEHRLRKDLPIIKELAELLINSQLGIQTKKDIWKSDKHRLSGARWMIGDSVIKEIEGRNSVPRRRVNLPKKVKLRTRQKKQFSQLCDLNFQIMEVNEGRVYFRIMSNDDCFQMLGLLDFCVGDIGVDLLNGVICSDSGTVESAERIAQVTEFTGELFCNGRMQLIDMEDDLLIAESKAFMPMNMFFDPEASTTTIKQWLEEAETRRKADSDNPTGHPNLEGQFSN